jgi:divinyl protochlorophyllide a 8-vinyl-reductase
MSNRRASISALELSRSHVATANPDRIGPNAVIQLIVALAALGETEAMARLFKESGREAWLEAPPEEMIPASEAARLHVGLRRILPRSRAEVALATAGHLTADYLLANRIPGVAQAFFKVLPPRLTPGLLLVPANSASRSAPSGSTPAPKPVSATTRSVPACAPRPPPASGTPRSSRRFFAPWCPRLPARAK